MTKALRSGTSELDILYCHLVVAVSMLSLIKSKSISFFNLLFPPFPPQYVIPRLDSPRNLNRTSHSNAQQLSPENNSSSHLVHSVESCCQGAHTRLIFALKHLSSTVPSPHTAGHGLPHGPLSKTDRDEISNEDPHYHPV